MKFEITFTYIHLYLLHNLLFKHPLLIHLHLPLLLLILHLFGNLILVQGEVHAVEHVILLQIILVSGECLRIGCLLYRVGVLDDAWVVQGLDV